MLSPGWAVPTRGAAAYVKQGKEAGAQVTDPRARAAAAALDCGQTGKAAGVHVAACVRFGQGAAKGHESRRRAGEEHRWRKPEISQLATHVHYASHAGRRVDRREADRGACVGVDD